MQKLCRIQQMSHTMSTENKNYIKLEAPKLKECTLKLCSHVEMIYIETIYFYT